MKYKDPGSPTISVNIGGTCIDKALLDLGASVNLLPYSVYKQLGLGELKPTNITLSWADRSVKIPKGIVEDVLVKVEKFYYPVDFVVFDIITNSKWAQSCANYIRKTIFGHCQCDNQLPKWSHATHIRQHDIGAQYLSLE